MTDENFTRQEDEIEALSAIYGTDFHTESKEHRSYSLEIKEGPHVTLLQVTMPSDYPSVAPPIYMLSAPWLKGLKRQELCGHLEDIYVDNAGDCIIYMWVEKIRQFTKEKLDADEFQPECSSESSELNLSSNLASVILQETTESFGTCPTIYSGDIITDRKSVFQPHLAAVHSQAEISQVLSKLHENKKIDTATHNIMAYRFFPEGTDTVVQDCNDDGETHAGSRMLHLLQILDAQNVLVVVTRWYGGSHLGPDRFKHINNAARQILDHCGYINPIDKHKKSKKGK